jgi:hypothetical protein
MCIFTTHRTLETEVEVAYCRKCPKKRNAFLGPDLVHLGVFNWNNDIGFSHELLNEYTNRFTSTETPFKAFNTQIVRAYREHHSEKPFCDRKTFLKAWFEYIKLQDLDMPTPLSCSICGEYPEVVIADGLSLGFAADKVTEHLRPPTATEAISERVKITKTKTSLLNTSGMNKLRKDLVKGLQTLDPDMEKIKYHLLQVIIPPAVIETLAHARLSSYLKSRSH